MRFPSLLGRIGEERVSQRTRDARRLPRGRCVMRPALDEKGHKDTLLLRSCVCSTGARLNITTCSMWKEGQNGNW